MSGFRVSVEAVDALSFRVATAASDVRSAAGQLQADACYATGDAALDGALGHFQQFWQGFSQEAAATVDDTAAKIAAAAQAYHHVDTTVMVDPSLTQAFLQATASGNSGTAQLLVAPLLPGESR
jgi:hypothetical protein